MGRELEGKVDAGRAEPERLSLAGLIGAQIATVVVAFGLLILFEPPLFASARADLAGIGGGIAGGLALIALADLLRALWPDFWNSLLRQVADLFRSLGGRLTWPVILLLSGLAGIGEELLMRGVQLWLADRLGDWAALVIAALAFGLLHPLSRAYVLIATVVGALLGLLFLATGNIVAPILAHAIYDIRAFVRLRGLIAELAAPDAPGDGSETDLR